MRGLLVVVDADEDSQKAFAAACSAIAFAGFPVPDSAFILMNERNFRTSVYMIPGVDECGTLEHLLLRSAFETAPTSEVCVDEFLACIGISSGEKSNTVAKMKMSALVAASFPANPWATPGMLLRSGKNNLVSAASGQFRHLADFLASFCTE